LILNKNYVKVKTRPVVLFIRKILIFPAYLCDQAFSLGYLRLRAIKIIKIKGSGSFQIVDKINEE